MILWGVGTERFFPMIKWNLVKSLIAFRVDTVWFDQPFPGPFVNLRSAIRNDTESLGGDINH